MSRYAHGHHNSHHSQSTVIRGRPVSQHEEALANNSFEHFLTASTLKTIFGTYRNICDHLHLKPNCIPHFYPKLKAHVNSWKAKPLWKKFDARANQKCYNRGKACPNTRVLIIGAGPCGLRTAIEAQLLGAKVVVVEKRDRMTRNNVLHLWPFVIEDLRALGAKKFFGKFCAGSIDHISIRQLQCVLMKVALLLGVEIHTEVSFERVIEPNLSEKTGWRAEFKPANHPVSQFEFDVIIGADGKRNTLQGFKRKEFRGKLAIAITANFINKRTEAEARVEEISGVAFIFNQKFFKDLYIDTGIDLENIVYYKDDTHYFVMTAKKQSLIEKGVIRQDLSDTAKLLAPENVNRDELMNYAREAAEFSTNYQMIDLEFAVNHYGQPDVAMFDFTSMYAAENASRITERHGYRLLAILVGDSLLEPFWPTGSGCARGFLSSMDAAWAIRSWETATPLQVIAERESIYRLLAQTTPENLNKDYKSYTLDPTTRYPNLNKNVLLPHQVTNQYDSDNAKNIEIRPVPLGVHTEVPKKRRRRESHVDPDTLLGWIQDQVKEYESLDVTNITMSFKDGRVLCAIIHHYRPDLLDYGAINHHEPAKNNQVAFDVLEKELGIPPVMTGVEMAQTDAPDYLTQLSYLTQIYDTFRCEIPHIKHPKLELPEPKRTDSGDFKIRSAPDMYLLDPEQVNRTPSRHKRSTESPFGMKPLVNQGDRKPRKRKTVEKIGASVEERQKRFEEIVANRVGRQNKRRQQRRMQTEQFLKSMQMLHSNCKPDHSEPFEDYSIYLYRQTAPNFEDRVKNLEKQFVYIPDRENRLPTAQAKRETDEDFAARIKDMEQKWQETQSVDKKPRDLLRAIGKIETSDWNIREIEKKIHENKMGKSMNKDKEKVPKWSKEQFSARLTKMEKQHLDRQNSGEVKYAEIDKNIKQLDLKLKEGSALNLNQQKVASIAEKLTGKNEQVPSQPKTQPIQKSNSRSAVVPSQNSEFCHFCQKRVYLMERLSAEGRFFHRGCFRCQYCQSMLRLGSYMFDREGIHGYRFYCTQHFGMPGELRVAKVEQKKTVQVQETVPGKQPIPGVLGLDLLDRVQTPERVEFSNLSSGHISSDHEESPSPIDEDEWTDRNFRNSVIDSDSTDGSSSSSDTDSDDEAYEEALEEPITKEGNMKWAERYKKRYSHKYHDPYSDHYSSSDHFSYDENSSGEDDSDTATEGEEEIRARELRKQEVRVEPPVPDTGTDTEIASCESSSESSSEIQNSATEISTDSEFAHDDPTPTRDGSKKMFDGFVTKTRGTSGQPKKVQVKSSVLQEPTNGRTKSKDIELKFTPLIPSPVLRKPPPISLFAKNEGYSLNRTQSTGGIATKVSLELKKKYLLGEANQAGNIQKSGSASTLDSKFKSFHTNISDCQKLLKPASEISASMQVFCSKLNERTSPLSPIFGGPTIFGNKDKTSPGAELKYPVNFNGLKIESVPKLEITKCASTSCVPEPKSTFVDLTDTQKIEENKAEDVTAVINETEGRPRSPVHEKSIIVPVIDWEKNKKDKEKYVDSLSSTDSELDVNITSKSTTNNIPRLEVHDDSGAIVNEEFDSLNIETNRKIADLPKSINGEKKTLNQPKILPDLNNDSILPQQHSALHVKEQDRKGSEIIEKEDNKSVKSGRSTPSITEDINVAALTETELSDWAREGTVSDDLEDVAFDVNPKNRANIKALSSGGKYFKKAVIDEMEDHVCAKNKEKKDITECVNILSLNIENIEFMDTGTESSDDNIPTKNNGYVQFHNEDEFLEDSLSPVILINDIVETANPLISQTPVEEETNKNNIEEKNVEKLRQNCDNENDDSLVTVETGTTTEENTCSDSTMKLITEKMESISRDFETIEETNEKLSEIVNEKRNQEEDKTDKELHERQNEKLNEQTNDKLNEAINKITNERVNEEPDERISKIINERTIKRENETGQDLCEKINENMTEELILETVPIHTDVETPTNEENKMPSLEFDEHCQRLQSKIEFSNARDSIDIRKTRRKSKPDATKPDLIQEEKKNASVILLPVRPKLYKKEEIEKERNINQKLVQEMVMNKMRAQNKSLERKKRSRNSFSPIRPFDLSKSATTDIASQIKSTTAQNENVLNLQTTPDVLLSTMAPLQKSQTTCSFKKENIETVCVDIANKPPDINQTNDDVFDFKTPKAPPRTRCDEAKRTAEKLKQDARARLRLMSDEDLGLSPEDKMVKLRQKATKKMKENENIDIHIQDSIESLVINRERRNSLLYNNDTLKRNTSFRRSKSGNGVTQSSTDLTLKLSPVRPLELSVPTRTKSVSEINRPLALKPIEIKPKSSVAFCKSDPNLLTDQKKEKKSKDRERRKSITKFLADMFSKKKENVSTSPPSQNKGFLSRISPKSKTKSKSLFALDLENLDKLAVLPLRRNSISEVNLRRSVEDSNIPPPIPPLPKNYTGHSLRDESSEGENDLKRDLSSCDALDQSCTNDEQFSGRRSSRSGRKTARQAQLKRHRMAQEIQRKLEETEVKTRELEHRGVMVEKALRGETNDVADQRRDEADLLKEWFDLMRERTELRRYEKELMIRAQELELEDRHARLQHELRERLERDEPKSKEEVEIEGSIINEMMEIVAKRDSLIAVLEEDRLRTMKYLKCFQLISILNTTECLKSFDELLSAMLTEVIRLKERNMRIPIEPPERHCEEDRDFEEKMLAKGIHLTSMLKTFDK